MSELVLSILSLNSKGVRQRVRVGRKEVRRRLVLRKEVRRRLVFDEESGEENEVEVGDGESGLGALQDRNSQDKLQGNLVTHERQTSSDRQIETQADRDRQGSEQ